MSLIVEDGTGLSTAESYISVATFKAYADARGLSYGSATDTQIEQALRRATVWLDGTYGGYFIEGAYRIQIPQALVFPLSGLVDRAGYVVDPNSVPKQITNATAEAAIRELASPGSLTPDVTPGQIVKSMKAGSASIDFVLGSSATQSQIPVVSIIDGILATLISNRASLYSGRAVRG